MAGSTSNPEQAFGCRTWATHPRYTKVQQRQGWSDLAPIVVWSIPATHRRVFPLWRKMLTRRNIIARAQYLSRPNNQKRIDNPPYKNHRLQLRQQRQQSREACMHVRDYENPGESVIMSRIFDSFQTKEELLFNSIIAMYRSPTKNLTISTWE